jgi:hypothetical protein
MEFARATALIGRTTAENLSHRGKVQVYLIAHSLAKIAARAIFHHHLCNFRAKKIFWLQGSFLWLALCYYRQRSLKIFSTPCGCRKNVTDAPMRDRSEPLPASTDLLLNLPCFEISRVYLGRFCIGFAAPVAFRSRAFWIEDCACLSPLLLLSLLIPGYKSSPRSKKR